MEPLPNDILAFVLVFAFGLSHGVDADHLATVDGLTRCNNGRRIAPWCGCLFSLGHGVVVTSVALGSALLASRWNVPTYIEDCGVWVSIFFLTLLGLLNLRSVVLAEQGQIVRPVGLKGRLFSRLTSIRQPWLIVLVGAAFAMSFDTLSLAALFSLAAHQPGMGNSAVLALGLLFTAGMLVTDGINGLWISRLLAKTGPLACVASRVMGLGIGTLSLLVAGWGLGRHISPSLKAWSEGTELIAGCAVMAVIATSFLAAVWLAREQNLAMRGN